MKENASNSDFVKRRPTRNRRPPSRIVAGALRRSRAKGSRIKRVQKRKVRPPHGNNVTEKRVRLLSRDRGKLFAHMLEAAGKQISVRCFISIRVFRVVRLSVVAFVCVFSYPSMQNKELSAEKIRAETRDRDRSRLCARLGDRNKVC